MEAVVKFHSTEVCKEEDIDFSNVREIANIEDLVDLLCIGVSRDYIFSGLTIIPTGTPSMNVQLNVGSAFCYSTKNICQNLSLISNILIENGGANYRYDVIQIRQKKNDYNLLARAFKDPTTQVITFQNVNTKTKVEFEISIVKGVEGNPAPNHTAGWIKIAEVYVSAGQSVQITSSDIKNVTASISSDTTVSWTSENTATVLLGKIIDNDRFIETDVAKLGGASLDLDNTLGGGTPSDLKIPSQKAEKNYIDNNITPGYEVLVNSDTTLLVRRKHKIIGSVSLSLPASPSEGDRIEIFSEDSCRIIQSDSNHSISLLNKYFTTKGTSGYLQLPNKSNMLMTYKGSGLSRIDTGSRLSDPDVLPSNNGTDCAFSPDGNYLAVTNQGANYLTIYKRSGDSFTKLVSQPDVLPTSAGNCCDFSYDGVYLAVGTTSTPYIYIYKRSGDTFTKLSNPGTLPAIATHSCKFSYDTIYLVLGNHNSPYISIYKRSGDTFNKLSNPITTPTGYGFCVSWTYDGNYVAISHGTTPFISIYKRDEDTFTKLANPDVLPPGTGNGCDFSYDGNYLAVVGSNASPTVVIYKRNGDSFNKLPDPSVMPPLSTINGCSFSFDGTYLAIVFTATSPQILIYKRFGDSFLKISDPVALGGTANRCRFSFDGAYLAVGFAVSPYIAIYKNLEAVTKQWLVETFNTKRKSDLKYLFK